MLKLNLLKLSVNYMCQMMECLEIVHFAHSVYLCILNGSQYKQWLFP